MSVLVISSPRFAEHMTPPGHPERFERAHVMDAVAARWRERGGSVASPDVAPREALARVHDAGYLEQLEALRGRSAMLDADTFTSPESVEVAQLAAGGALRAAEHARAGGRALALVRPPGHHAGRRRAMGFCLYNNVAVAAADALAEGASRVAIVDIDVHHGNGTQEIFYTDPRVLYVSIHQFPFYPGTGAVDEVGEGPGAGFTVNVPLPAGATDADYLLVTREIVVPVVEAFGPDLLLVSAGFDAHERDPLGGMRVTTDGYRGLLHALRAVADRAAGGRLAVVTEGGYDLEALAACCVATVDVLAAPDAPPPASPPAASGVGEAACTAVRAAQRAYWPTL